MSRIVQQTLALTTRGRGFSNISSQLNAIVREAGIVRGLCTVFVRHTSASLLIQENADPAVLRDLERWLSELAPETRRWEHDDEGSDDMPAHAKSALTRTNETIPISGGRLVLGTWQAVYLWEHRARPHQREVFVHLSGD
jgi:secondary thiamine-phosphate synthase enzyme